MKTKLLALLSIAVILFPSCKKEQPGGSATPATPTTLLSTVIQNTVGDPGFGKPLLQFTYNQKQLVKVISHTYPDVNSGGYSRFGSTTYLLAYDTNGNLTTATFSDTLSYTNPIYGPTTTSKGVYYIYNTGKDISEIANFPIQNEASPKQLGGSYYLFSYQNGLLVHMHCCRDTTIYSYDIYDHDYSYDGNGNLTTDQQTYQYNAPVYPYSGSISSTTNYSNYDTKNCIAKSIPNFLFVENIIQTQNVLLPMPLTTNNPMITDQNNTPVAINYQYNNFGFPSVYSDGYSPYSYLYEYIQVN